MQLTINVDETQFKDIIEKELAKENEKFIYTDDLFVANGCKCGCAISC